MKLASKTPQLLVFCDQISERLPLVSTITQIVVLALKCLIQLKTTVSETKNRYIQYVQDKPLKRCLALLVPGFGNFAIGIYDFVANKQAVLIKDEEINEFYNQGEEKLKNGKIDEAIQCFIDATENGSTKAMYQLGLIYQKKAEKASSDFEKTSFYEQAFFRFITSANKGYSPAMCQVARAYRFGHGVHVNHPESLKWLKQAASKQDKIAIALLGNVYEEGDLGTVKDSGKVMSFHKKAAEKGVPQSMYHLALLCAKQNNINQALYWHERAAKEGVSDSMFEAGLIYYKQNNFRFAPYWLRQAYNAGNKNAAYYLGEFSRVGQGTYPKDDLQACKFYLEATLEQDALYLREALNQLNALATVEILKEIDRDLILHWFNKAIEVNIDFPKKILQNFLF